MKRRTLLKQITTGAIALPLMGVSDFEKLTSKTKNWKGKFSLDKVKDEAFWKEFKKEHYDISMKIGGEGVFPAVNAKDSDWDVAVMGISCRQQIEHGTDRHPRHMIEVFADSLS